MGQKRFPVSSIATSRGFSTELGNSSETSGCFRALPESPEKLRFQYPLFDVFGENFLSLDLAADY